MKKIRGVVVQVLKGTVDCMKASKDFGFPKRTLEARIKIARSGCLPDEAYGKDGVIK
jgi:hypothetical protein